MDISSNSLAGMHILIVEDETAIAIMLEDILLDLGCNVGVAQSIGEALALIRTSTFRGALLDMNLRGETSLPVAEELAGQSIPFLLLTGYGPQAAEPTLTRMAPRLTKPFTVDELTRRMTDVFV